MYKGQSESRRSVPPRPPVSIQGTKHDQQKPDLSLLPPEAILEISKVLTFGANKYDAHNWRGGFNWTRLSSASLRHIFSWLGGETYDPESGLNHLAHAACGLMFLLAFAEKKLGNDDRYVEGK